MQHLTAIFLFLVWVKWDIFWTFSFWLFHRMVSTFLRSGFHKGWLNSEVMFVGGHTKIVSHISQDSASTEFENVQARQAFS